MSTEATGKLFDYIKRNQEDGACFWEYEFVKFAGDKGTGYVGTRGLTKYESIDIPGGVGNEGDYPPNVKSELGLIADSLFTQIQENALLWSDREKSSYYERFASNMADVFKRGFEMDAWATGHNTESNMTRYARWLGVTIDELKSNTEALKRKRNFRYMDISTVCRSMEILKIYDAIEIIKPVGSQTVKRGIFTPKPLEQATPKNFQELFYDSDDLEECVTILRNHWPESPIISDTLYWQRRDGAKGVLSAWIRSMENAGIIKTIRPIQPIVPLLNAYFPGLDIGLEARTLKGPDESIVAEFRGALLPRIHNAS